MGCYPIPGEVAEQLNRGAHAMELKKNVPGPQGHASLGSYCVRCLVWRPPNHRERGKSHHCGICQRCYTSFDHHCSVFGRCIVGSNLPAFYTLIALVPLAVATGIVPVIMSPVQL